MKSLNTIRDQAIIWARYATTEDYVLQKTILEIPGPSSRYGRPAPRLEYMRRILRDDSTSCLRSDEISANSLLTSEMRVLPLQLYTASNRHEFRNVSERQMRTNQNSTKLLQICAIENVLAAIIRTELFRSFVGVSSTTISYHLLKLV